MLRERRVEVVGERHAVVRVRRAASRCRPRGAPRRTSYGSSSSAVSHDGRVVLAVDEGQGARHERVVTSSSIRPVYFSYSKVSIENWMIRSCPWNGYLRQTSTWRPGDLDHVVTGAGIAAEPQRRDRAGVDDEQVLEPPGVRDVLVPGEHEVDAARAAGTRSRHPRRRSTLRSRPVPAPAAGDGAARRSRSRARPRELLLDPAVAAAPDLAVVEVGLASSRPRRRSPVRPAAPSCARRRAPRSGRSRRSASRGCPGSRRPTRTRSGRGSARASWYSCLKPNVVRSPEQTTMSGFRSLISLIARSSRLGTKYWLAAVQVGEVRDREARTVRRPTMSASKVVGPSGGVATSGVRCPRQTPGISSAYSGAAAHVREQVELECAKMLDFYGVPWEYEPRTFVLEQDEDGRVDERVHARLLPPRAGSLRRGDGDEAVARDTQEPEAARAARALPRRQGQALLPARHRAPGPAIRAELAT